VRCNKEMQKKSGAATAPDAQNARKRINVATNLKPTRFGMICAEKRENVMENSTIEFERKAYHEILDWKAKLARRIIMKKAVSPICRSIWRTVCDCRNANWELATLALATLSHWQHSTTSKGVKK